MKLSIITINFNNADGLRKTLASVASQTHRELEHVIIDGGSTDDSVDVIREYESANQLSAQPLTIIWISEPDKGIYHAMNKGIRMASGEYLQFLNSGDSLLNAQVTEKMLLTLNRVNKKEELGGERGIGVLYGNMRKQMLNGKILHDSYNPIQGVTLTMFYRGCLNHSSSYIRHDLFDKNRMYDETLQICADWKFFMETLVLGKESALHVDLDVTLYDMGGISEIRKDILNKERNRLLQEMVPQGILADYNRYHIPMEQYDRLKRHHLWGLIWFIERILFKLEKWGILK